MNPSLSTPAGSAHPADTWGRGCTSPRSPTFTLSSPSSLTAGWCRAMTSSGAAPWSTSLWSASSTTWLRSWWCCTRTPPRRATLRRGSTWSSTSLLVWTAVCRRTCRQGRASGLTAGTTSRWESARVRGHQTLSYLVLPRDCSFVHLSYRLYIIILIESGKQKSFLPHKGLDSVS